MATAKTLTPRSLATVLVLLPPRDKGYGHDFDDLAYRYRS